MENSDNLKKCLVKEFTYNVPVEKVWQALTDKDKMRICYFPQLLNFEPVVGYTFQFDNYNSEYQKEWIVTKVEEGKKIAHIWAYKVYPGCSEVIFEIFAEGESTKLNVTQTNLDSFPKHPISKTKDLNGVGTIFLEKI